jgi:hypothetical protein
MMLVKNSSKAPQLLLWVTIAVVLGFGLAMAWWPIRPFWNDEWRLLYNLKFKTANQLWGPLDLLQQFPRLYLVLLKKVVSGFGYSYTALRLHAFVLGCVSIWLVVRLRRLLYPTDGFYSYLFPFMFIGSTTFIDYLVQTKQYEMELLASLLPLWLLHHGYNSNRWLPTIGIAALGGLAPMFSYYFPVVVVPALGVLVWWALQHAYHQQWQRGCQLGLLICIIAAGLLVSYRVDVRHVMADPYMHQYWAFRMMGGGAGMLHLGEHIWLFFAQVGAGLVFQIVFGLLGITAFVHTLWVLARTRLRLTAFPDWVLLYSTMVVCFALLLFVGNKLPIGEPRLTAFAIPAIAIMIVSLLSSWAKHPRHNKLPAYIAVVLLLALAGNALTANINAFADGGYTRKMQVYSATSAAVALAAAKGIPLIVTEGVYGGTHNELYNFEDKLNGPSFSYTHEKPLQEMTPDIVAKVLPAYNPADSVLVYYVRDANRMRAYLKELPATTKAVVAGDGLHFSVLYR